MIHLKPLTHHGLQTHKPHKQGYLKWHYHPNTQDTNANQATQTYQHIKDHEPKYTTQWDNNTLYTFPQELHDQLQKEYKTHIPTPTGPITHTHNQTNNTYQITDGTETITINAQQILKQAAKHTNDKNTLKHLLKTLKHIQQDLQQHGPHQGLLHPNDRTPQTMITQQQHTTNTQLLERDYYQTQYQLNKLSHHPILKHLTKRKQKQLKQQMTNTLNHATANYKRHIQNSQTNTQTQTTKHTT